MEQVTTRYLRFRLRSLLIVIAFVAVVTGWFTDHGRLASQFQQSGLRNEILNDQISVLQTSLHRKYELGRQNAYCWANADEFVEMVVTTPETSAFLDMHISLAIADERVFDESIVKLTALLDLADERTKNRVLSVFAVMVQSEPDRMGPHVSAIVRKLIPLLQAESNRIVGQTIMTIREIGPGAHEAIEPLTKLMLNDRSDLAVFAALTIAQIDPTIDIGPRLIEIVEKRHQGWEVAAYSLSRHTDDRIARDMLTKLYDDAKNESERNVAIHGLNEFSRVPW